MDIKNLSKENQKKIEDAYVKVLMCQVKLLEIYCNNASEGRLIFDLSSMYNKAEETKNKIERILSKT
jgi:hypothetical protein